MKSAIIWNEIETLRYAVVEGDWREFEGVYINACDSDQDKVDRLLALVYDETYRQTLNFCTIDVFAEAIRNGAVAVECGFLP